MYFIFYKNFKKIAHDTFTWLNYNGNFNYQNFECFYLHEHLKTNYTPFFSYDLIKISLHTGSMSHIHQCRYQIKIHASIF